LQQNKTLFKQKKHFRISLYAKEKVKRNNSKEEKYRFVGNKCIKAEDCKGPDK
jgi:hypothetical protein